jgi:hypothetical protein
MGLGVLTGERTQHRYQTCGDEDCQRYACRVYREGFREGYGAGHAAGTPRAEAGYSPGAAGLPMAPWLRGG